MDEKITIVIDKDVIERYGEWYFTLHPKARKNPIKQPYHESINTWMIMRRPAMNGLKQRWKDFIRWLVRSKGYDSLRIDKCEISQTIYFPTKRRHDIDNSVPKFILDGLVESGMIVDDDCEHITKLTLECGYDQDYPRTEIVIDIQHTENEEDTIDG